MSIKLRTPHVITLLDRGGDPAAEPNIIKLYAKNPTTGTTTELYVVDETGASTQITSGGKLVAGALKTATGVVTISTATAPNTGDALVATSSTTAAWSPASGGGLTLTGTDPVTVDANSAVLGGATTAARGDHKHSVLTAEPSTLAAGGTNTLGASTSLARADHIHQLPSYGNTANTLTEGNDARLSNDRVASGIRTLTTVVSVSGAVAPTVGQTLVASNGSTAIWGTAVAGPATALATTGAPVVVNTAGPPSAGQVLTAETPTSAKWTTVTGGGGGGGSIPFYGFDLTRGNTDQGAPDEIANTLFNATGLSGVLRFVAVLECSAAGQTASLELYNVTDGLTVVTVSTTNTTATRRESAILTTLPAAEKLYGARLFRTGGSSADRVTCRLARIENAAS